MLAGVAHELNNPLSVVVGQATLLMEGSPEPKVVDARRKDIQSRRPLLTHRQKLSGAGAAQTARTQAGATSTSSSTAPWNCSAIQLRTGNIDVQLDLDPTLPEITGDADQLTQVVTNLVLNAAQAMEGWKGPRRITITQPQRRRPGRR